MRTSQARASASALCWRSCSRSASLLPSWTRTLCGRRVRGNASRSFAQRADSPAPRHAPPPMDGIWDLSGSPNIWLCTRGSCAAALLAQAPTKNLARRRAYALGCGPATASAAPARTCSRSPPRFPRPPAGPPWASARARAASTAAATTRPRRPRAAPPTAVAQCVRDFVRDRRTHRNLLRVCSSSSSAVSFRSVDPFSCTATSGNITAARNTSTISSSTRVGTQTSIGLVPARQDVQVSQASHLQSVRRHVLQRSHVRLQRLPGVQRGDRLASVEVLAHARP